MHTRILGPLSLALVLMAALVNCSRRDASSSPAPVASDALVASSASEAKKQAGARAPDPIELLYAVPSLVVVSSRVDNPHDLPDFIVDRKPETAWNGRSGDLVGGYVGFRVPKDAHVAHVELSVGYDKKTDKKDLFTANVRIKKVRVWRNRKALKEAVLDPDKRTPQRIEINAGGGDFKLEVIETVTGTMRAWRELVVSELSVWGSPGVTVKTSPTPPPVRVGGLDSSIPVVERPKLAPTLEAACRAFEADSLAAFEAEKANGTYIDPDKKGGFTCHVGSLVAGAPSSPLLVELRELDETVTNPFVYDDGDF